MSPNDPALPGAGPASSTLRKGHPLHFTHHVCAPSYIFCSPEGTKNTRFQPSRIRGGGRQNQPFPSPSSPGQLDTSTHRRQILSFILQAIFTSTDVVQVNISAETGDMGILANHAPAIEPLRPGVVEVLESGNSSQKWFGMSDTFSLSFWCLIEYRFSYTNLRYSFFCELNS